MRPEGDRLKGCRGRSHAPALMEDQDAAVQSNLDFNPGSGIAGPEAIWQHLQCGAVKVDKVFEAQDRIKGDARGRLAIGRARLSRCDAEPPIVSWQEVQEHPVGLLNGSCAGEAHLRDQAVLKGVPRPLHSTLGLRCMGQDEPNAQFFQRPGELRGVTPSPELLFQTLRLPGGVPGIAAMPVAVQGQPLGFRGDFG